MKIGELDHSMPMAAPLAALYEASEADRGYDRAGIYSYHLPSTTRRRSAWRPRPACILAAVAQRTRRLRFGPLVYTLSLYHPLRLAEEICMLDQMSGGRWSSASARGVSPHRGRLLRRRLRRTPARCTSRRSQIILQALTDEDARFRGRVLPLQGRADRARAAAEAASAAVVRRGRSRQRRCARRSRR